MEKYSLIVQQYDNLNNIKRQIMFLEAPEPIIKKLEEGNIDNEIINYFGASEIEELIKQLEQPGEAIAFDIYGFDTVKSLSDKIFANTDIPFFRQYLSIELGNSLSHLLKDSHDKELDVFYNDAGEDLYGATVDRDLYTNRDTYSQHGREYAYLAKDFLKKGLNIIKLIDIADIINIGKYTETEIDLMYYGFVWKFWPMNIDLFKSYLDGTDQSSYPDLFQKRMGFPIDEFIKTAANKAPMETIQNINYIEYTIYGNSDIIIDNLFQILHCSHEIPIMTTMTKRKRNIIYYTKVHTELEYNKLYIDYKHHLYLRRNELSLLYIVEDRYYTIRFTNRYYAAKFFPHSDDLSITKSKDAAISDINEMINRINKLGNLVFTSNNVYNKATPDNMVITDLSLNIIIPVELSPSDIAPLISNMRSSNIFRIESGEDRKIIATFLYEYCSDIMSYMQKSENRYYSYQTDITIKSLFDTYYKRHYDFVARIDKNININIDNVDIHVSNILIDVITYFLNNLKFNVSTEAVSYGSLKLADPVLFDLGKYAIGRNYCRLCQKKMQPIAINENDYNKLSDKDKSLYTKYWNFTNNTPIYYKCPNKNIPYIGFIIDKHPSGYCLPCCGKRKPIEGSKKYNIYNKCIEEYKYKGVQDTETNFVRYIMNYNRDKMEAGRLYKLPSIIDTYLYSIMADPNIYREYIRIKGVKYTLQNIKALIEPNKTYMKPIKPYIDSLKDKIPNKNITYERLLKEPHLAETYYNKILNTEDYIIIYGKEMIYGTHVIAQAVIRGEDKVRTKKVGNKILKKSAKLDKNIYYYIMVTPASYKGIDLSSLYAISVAADIPVDKLIEDILLAKIDEQAQFDIAGIYSHSFSSYSDIIKEFRYEIENNVLSDNDWNYLIIHSCRSLLGIDIITYEMKGENIYINTYGRTRLTKPLVCMLFDGRYFPVLYTSSKNFLNNILKKFYEKGDVIYDMTENVIQSIRKNEAAEYYKIFGDKLKEVYIINNIIVHHIAIEFNNVLFKIPCTYHNYSTEHKKIYGGIKLSEIDYGPDDMAKFIKYYNETSNGRVNMIQIESYIMYEDNVIGFACSGLYYYFKPSSVNNLGSLSSHEVMHPKIINLLYHPDDLNDILKSYVISSIDINTYLSATYKKNIMVLASIELFSKIKIDELINARDQKNFILNKIRDLFEIGKPNMEGTYLVSKCGIDKSIYCKGDKLILDEDMVNGFIETVIADIKNPAKIKLLQDGISVFSIIGTDTFQLGTYERLYINIY